MKISRGNITPARITLGCFTDLDDAVAARRAAETEHGFHPNHGRSGAQNAPEPTSLQKTQRSPGQQGEESANEFSLSRQQARMDAIGGGDD